MANFLENGHGSFERLFVLRAGGHIVAHAFLFELRVALAGTLVPFGGIATVGVAPEARGRGFGTALVSALHAEASREGLAGTLLYAFRQGFYRRLGYGRTPLRASLDAHPASFVVRAHEARVRPARTDEDFALMAVLHEGALAASTLGHQRPERLWSHLRCLPAREWILAERDGRAVGYLFADRGCNEVHGPVSLAIGDFIAIDSDAEHALLSWVSSQRDQVERVAWEHAASDLERIELIDPDRHRHGTARIEHPLGTVSLGPMVRVTDDFAPLLRARLWPEDGLVRVAIMNAHGDRARAWRICVRMGRASVEELAPDAQVDLVGEHHDLSSLLAGGVSFADLRSLRVVGNEGPRFASFFALAPARLTDAF